MDASRAGRVTPAEDTCSLPSQNVADHRCAGQGPEAADPASGQSAVVLGPPAVERRSAPDTGCADFAYACPQASAVSGFAEPPREPGPKAPAFVKGDGAEGELERMAEAFVGMLLADVERLVIEATIRACVGSLPKAARVLGVSPSTLYRKRAGWVDRSNTP